MVEANLNELLEAMISIDTPFFENKLVNLIYKALKSAHSDNGVGIEGVRQWKHIEEEYELIGAIGNSEDKIGMKIPEDHESIKAISEKRIVLNTGKKDIETILNTSDNFVEIAVGSKNLPDYIFVVDLKDLSGVEHNEKHPIYTLQSTINSALKNIKKKKILKEILLEAKENQQRSLPKSQPDFKGYDIFAGMKPYYWLGGDYYNFSQTKSQLGFSLADVSGKGAQAATLVQGLHGFLSALADLYNRPKELTSRLNKYLFNATDTKYATMFLGSLSKPRFWRRSKLKYTNAGHNPPFILRKNKIEDLSEGGMVIGYQPNEKYIQKTTYLKPGDIFVVYSDGIVEPSNIKDEEFGIDQLKEIVSKNRDLPMESVYNLVIDSLKDYRRDRDDETLMLFKRL